MEINDETERIGYLVAKELTHDLTGDESSELGDWKRRYPAEAEKISGLLKKDRLQQTLAELDEVEEKITRDFIKAGMPVIHQQKSPDIFHFRKLWYAAAMILIIAAAAVFYRQRPIQKPELAYIPQNNTTAAVIAPGKQGAILTLADGSTMLLDSLGNGNIAVQGNTRITLQNGHLAYTKLGGSKAETSYNIMTTPKGRQFHLILPDGTRAWLNAASSLRYPVVFSGNDREVEVTGEVYFEVAPDAGMPFKVSINQETAVEVIGTSFNIKAYSNERKIYTTLLNGAVRMASGTQKSMLTPGQQAEVNTMPMPAEQIKINRNVDQAKVMAWKNGLFNFQDVKLEELMRQISRWYDIEVVYQGAVPTMEFWGKMGMDLPLADVLSFLEKSDVHFRIEGRTLIVSK